jgi:hypothetical protein
VHFEIKENSDYHKNRDELQKKYQAIPFVTCLPEEQREEFFNQVITAGLQQEPSMADGTIRDHGFVVCMLLEKQ